MLISVVDGQSRTPVASEVTRLSVEQSWYVRFRYWDTTDVAVPLYRNDRSFHGATLSTSPMHLPNKLDELFEVFQIVVGA